MLSQLFFPTIIMCAHIHGTPKFFFYKMLETNILEWKISYKSNDHFLINALLACFAMVLGLENTIQCSMISPTSKIDVSNSLIKKKTMFLKK